MPRRFAPREIDPATGAVALALYDEEKARKAISNHHRLTVRTSEALRKLVLFAEPECIIGKSEIRDYAQGQVDPAVQLVLKARDEFLNQNNKDFVRLGFFKEMRALLQEVKIQTAVAVGSMHTAIEKQRDREQSERHHQDKLEVLREKSNKDKSGSTIRDLMDRAMDGMIEQKVDEQLDRLAPIVIEDVPEVDGDDPGGG